MYLGFAALEGTIPVPYLVKDANGSPVAPDALPTYRVYGPAGLMTGGSGSLAQLDSQTGLYSVGVQALAANAYVQGQTYTVLVRCAVSGVAKGELHSFTVV